MQRIVALTFFTMFPLVTSLIHTFVSLVRKSNQASCVVMAHTEATLVLVKTYFAFRHGLILHWFKDLINVTGKLNRRNVCTLLSRILIRGDDEGSKRMSKRWVYEL